MNIEEITAFLATDEGKELILKSEAVQGLVAKKDELLSKSVTLQEKVRKYEAFGDADTLAAQIAEYKKLKEGKSGKEAETTIDPKLAAEVEHLRNEVKTRDETFNKLQASIVNTGVDAQVTTEITKANGIPELLKPIISQRVKGSYDIETGKLEVSVMNPDGSPMFKNGKPASIEDLINEYKANEVFGGAFRSNSVSGTGTRQSGGKATSDMLDPTSPNFSIDALMRQQAKTGKK